MILESLRIMLFGMIGIFVVMGIIVLALYLLKKFSKNDDKESKENAE